MPIDVGTRAPDFVLKDQNNQPVRLSDEQGHKTVLLIFYPLAFTDVCCGELREVQANLDAYQNEDIQVLAVSVDSVFSNKVWSEREGFTFPLLSDFWPHGAVADAYGVFNATSGFAYRGTFVIDRTGVIRFAEMNQPGDRRDQRAWRAALAEVAGVAASSTGS